MYPRLSYLSAYTYHRWYYAAQLATVPISTALFSNHYIIDSFKQSQPVWIRRIRSPECKHYVITRQTRIGHRTEYLQVWTLKVLGVSLVPNCGLKAGKCIRTIKGRCWGSVDHFYRNRSLIYWLNHVLYRYVALLRVWGRQEESTEDYLAVRIETFLTLIPFSLVIRDLEATASGVSI